MFRFERLEIWQDSIKIIQDIYKICKLLPSSEKGNLSDQLKRSVTSISLNIAEGSGSQSDTEYRRYLFIAKKSLFETVALLKIIESLYNIKRPDIEKKLIVLTKRLSSLINKLSN